VKKINNTFIKVIFIWLFLFAFPLGKTFAIEQVRVQPGHTIAITVSGHPEFSQRVIVRRDGTTEYPLLTGIPLIGLTGDDIRDLLLPILIRFESEPEVFVIVSEVRMIQFQVLGEVLRPGRFTQQMPIDLQQALILAGGTLENANTREIQILRIKDENRITLKIDLRQFFRGDSLELAPKLENNDIVVVTRNDLNKAVRVIGAVISPGLYFPEPGANLADVIFNDAKGFKPSGKRNKILLITKRNGMFNREVYNLKHIFKNDRYKDLPLVLPGDIIIVENREEWRSMSWWYQTLRVMIETFTLYFLVTRI